MQALPVRPVTLWRGPLSPPPSTASSQSAAATAAPTAPWLLGRAQLSGTGFFFILYLILLAVEFTGLPNQYPILKAVKFSTILSYGLVGVVISKAGMADVFGSRAAKLLFGFLVFTWLSVFWAYIQSYAINSVRPLFDYLGLMIITAYLLDRRSRMDWFAATFSLVAIWLVAENFEKLNSGGPRKGAFKAPYFMGDGNDFAWWLALALPLAFSLAVGKRSWLLRGIGVAGTGACLLGIMGTGSRGAFLGIAGAFMYGWLFVSKKKTVGAVFVGAVALVMVIAAPAGYFQRMNTVTEYEKDNSAQARIQAWKAGLHMAMDHPLGVGAGNFPSVHGRFYMPSDENNRVGWGGRRWANAHSIYFKVLGEYGFPGLLMLLITIGTLVQHNTASRRIIQAAPDGAPFNEYWPAFVNMSTIAFAMCGIFLGGFNYPHLFLLTGLCIAVRRIIRLESANAAPVRPGARLVRPAGAGAVALTGVPAIERRAP
jgi:probable O-glycosylation ligase (exosortase A-associated)